MYTLAAITITASAIAIAITPSTIAASASAGSAEPSAYYHKSGEAATSPAPAGCLLAHNEKAYFGTAVSKTILNFTYDLHRCGKLITLLLRDASGEVRCLKTGWVFYDMVPITASVPISATMLPRSYVPKGTLTDLGDNVIRWSIQPGVITLTPHYGAERLLADRIALTGAILSWTLDP